MTKCFNIYNGKYDQYGVRCFLKLLTNTNNIKYIRNKTKSNLRYSHYNPEKFLLKRIDKDGNIFSQTLGEC